MIALQILGILSTNFWSLRWGSKSLVRILSIDASSKNWFEVKNVELIKNDIF